MAAVARRGGGVRWRAAAAAYGERRQGDTAAGGDGGGGVADWSGAAEAAQRLGIKQASLYSYVSRGVLTRRRSAADRVSLFDAREVDTLARRGRTRRVA